MAGRLSSSGAPAPPLGPPPPPPPPLGLGGMPAPAQSSSSLPHYSPVHQPAPSGGGGGAGESLYASPTDPLLSLNDYSGPDFDHSQFFGSFWTPDAPSLDDGFEELKKYLRQGSDFCKDVVDLFRERAALEDMYAKRMLALYTKSLKLSEYTYGTLRTAWDAVLGEFKERGEWHMSICDNIKKSVADPLAAFKEQQKKDHKAAQAPVEKAHKNYVDFANMVAKHKRTAFGRGREAETANAAVDEARQPTGPKVYTEKDVARLSKAATAAEKQRDKADGAYRDALDKLAQVQEDWETAMIAGCKALQVTEEERIGFMRKVLLEYAEHSRGLVTQEQTSMQSMVTKLTAINVPEDINTISSTRGTGPYVAVMQLYDACQENLQWPMDATRRRACLVDRLDAYRKDVDKKERMRAGLVKLWEATRDMVRDGKCMLPAIAAVSRQLVSLDFKYAAAHANVYKLRSVLADVTATARPASSLQTCITRKEDKVMNNSSLRLQAGYRVPVDNLRHEAAEAARNDAQYGEAMDTATRRMSMAVSRMSRPLSTAVPSYAAPIPSASGSHSSLAPPPPPPPHAEDDDFDDEFADEEEQPPAASAYVCRCQVMYDYEPNEPDELRLRAGEVIDVYDTSDETWWQGVLNGASGMFPAAYVQQLQ